MTRRLVILGGGTGGTLMANRLQTAPRRRPRDHRRRPGRPPRLPTRPALRPVRPRRPRRHRAAPAAPAAQGRGLPSGRRRSRRHRGRAGAPRRRCRAALRRARRGHRRPALPEETEGLTGPGWNEKVFTFYDLPGATALHQALEALRRRSPRAERRRHADQVPGRPARVRLPRRLVLPGAGHPRQGRADLRHPPRRRLHQADGGPHPRRHARREGRRAGDRVQHRRGRRRGRPARLLRRARGPVRPRRGDPPPRRRRVRRPLPGPRRRARLRADRPAHPAVEGAAEHLRHRRRHQRAGVEGRVGHPLRGRGPDRERQPLPRRSTSSTSPTTATPTASSRPASTRRC